MSDPLERMICGDCRDILPTLPAQSVQCCVSSPPYWGLRDYGTAQWEGGSIWCEHKPTKEWLDDNFNGESSCVNGKGSQPATGANRWYEKDGSCKCGARRIDLQLGLEATPEEYIAKMVAVFREVKRVLRDDGTLWVNMGDSYASTGSNGFDGEVKQYLGSDGKPGTNCTSWSGQKRSQKTARTAVTGIKPKDLCMMPARLAMALQADGWYLRSEIVWHKPNPMPESVTDRPTKAHEMIYLLAKQERYFYDAEAIREPADFGRLITPNQKPIRNCKSPSTMHWGGVGDAKNPVVRNGDWSGQYRDPDSGRNKRSVWTIATQPYAEAHFATFPEEIPKLCILAGSKPGDVILDPFAGSGTTGKVAIELGRKAILIELNPEYMRLARARTWVTPGFF